MAIKETLRFKGDFDYKLSTKLIFRVLTNAMEIDASVSYETSLIFFIKQSLLSVTYYCRLKINLFRLKNYETVGIRYFTTITSQNIDGYCFLFNRLNGLSS